MTGWFAALADHARTSFVAWGAFAIAFLLGALCTVTLRWWRRSSSSIRPPPMPESCARGAHAWGDPHWDVTSHGVHGAVRECHRCGERRDYHTGDV